MPLFQLRSATLALAGALALPDIACAASDQFIGHVDSLTAQHAIGWTCLRESAAPVNIALYVGATLLGVYPANIARPDVASMCGGTAAHGFAIGFDVATQAQFAGQTSLTVQANTGGMESLLPVSSPHTANPFALPSGVLFEVDGAGEVEGYGAAGQAGAPRIAIFAGGPPGQGGVLFGTGPAKSTLASTAFEFSVGGVWPAALAGNDAPGATRPLYGVADDGTGGMVPLANPLAVSLAGEPGMAVPLGVIAAQSGSRSGITNTLATTWLPAGSAFTSLTGNVSLTGNDASFAEALILLGVTGDAEAACLAQSGTWPSQAPSILRLWAAILKNTGTGMTSVPVNFALPAGVALRGSGSGLCLATLVSAGYPYLNRMNAKYSRTTVNLTAGFDAVPPAVQSMAPVGLGGEFKFDTAAGPGATTYVGLKAARRLTVDGIAGSVSAAAVAGAPTSSGWQPAPAGLWRIGTSFVYLPAPSCQAAGLVTQSANGTFSILRHAAPAAFTLPAGTRTVASLPLAGSDIRAVQRSAFWAFSGASKLTLDPGDCLVAFQHLTTPATPSTGRLDYENQSTAYLRLSP